MVHRVFRLCTEFTGGASSFERCIESGEVHRVRAGPALDPLAPLAVPRMSAFPLRDMCGRRIALNAGGYDVLTARAIGEGA